MKIHELLAKAKAKIWTEAMIYGILASAYASLFFFGALYPGYGMPAQSVVYDEEEENSDATEYDEKEIQFKSLLWEQLKEWF